MSYGSVAFTNMQSPKVLTALANYTLSIDTTGTKILASCTRCDDEFALPDLPGDMQDLCLTSVVTDVIEHELNGTCARRRGH